MATLGTGLMWLPLSDRCTEAEARRILAKFVQYGNCWEWIGSKDDRGYGRCWYRGRNWHVTRLIVWIVAGELVPAGVDVAHECHNPGCGAPAHLQPTDATTNRSRRVAVYSDPLGWRARRELARQDNNPGCGAPAHLQPTDATTNRSRRVAVYSDPLGWRARRELARQDNHIKSIMREVS